MGAKIVALGRHAADFGRAKDRLRVKRMVDSCPNYLHGAGDRELFSNRRQRLRENRGINNWPEGAHEAEFFAVCFDRDLYFGDLTKVISSLPVEYRDLKRTMFPQLVAMIHAENMKEWVYQNGIRLISLTDPGSLMGYGVHDLKIPVWQVETLSSRPGEIIQSLSVRQVHRVLYKETFFLFYRD